MPLNPHQHLYNTNRWKIRSLRQRRREPLCASCKAAGRIVLADLADHVVKHDGDLELFWHGELQSLCSSCHSQRKQSVERRGYDRYSVDADGNPTDPLHPFNKKRL